MKPDLKDRYGEWALVAGAAQGLGRAFSLDLAARGMNLILVDLQEDLLDKLTIELEDKFRIQSIALHMDLASEESPGGMLEAVSETNCRLLVYNAAYSRVRKFLENEPVMLDRYVQVNIRTPLQLVHGFCRLHRKEQELKKGIVLMSSLAGSWGTQLLGPYGGTKAFNHILAESLYQELGQGGFHVLACIAGSISTPGYLGSLPEGKEKAISVMDPDTVVKAVFHALGSRAFVIPGFKNKVIYFLMTRILPRRASLRMMNRAVGNLYMTNTPIFHGSSS